MKIQMNKMKIIYKIQKRNEKFIKETVFFGNFMFFCVPLNEKESYFIAPEHPWSGSWLVQTKRDMSSHDPMVTLHPLPKTWLWEARGGGLPAGFKCTSAASWG